MSARQFTQREVNAIIEALIHRINDLHLEACNDGDWPDQRDYEAALDKMRDRLRYKPDRNRPKTVEGREK